MQRLEGKVAVITGAANGIGLAAAERFVAEGASVLLVDLHEGALQPVAERLGASATYLAADVSEPASAERFTATALQRYGRVDAAVLNAGTEGEIAPIGTYSLAGYERVMAVNVRSVWLGLSALMPVMKTAGGSIVITSSTAGLRSTPMIAAYGASKHAVVGLMKAAAVEGAADRIRVNTVNPGPTETVLMRAIEKGRNPNDPDAARRAGIARIPLQRYGRTEEIANMMLFLASDEASFCTGQTYVVDGGSLT